MNSKYFGLYFDYDTFRNLPYLYEYTMAITIQNLKINNGINIEDPENFDPFPSKPLTFPGIEKGVIIVLPYEYKNMFLTPSTIEFINDCIGHCFVTSDSKDKIIALYYICLHNQNIQDKDKSISKGKIDIDIESKDIEYKSLPEKQMDIVTPGIKYFINEYSKFTNVHVNWYDVVVEAILSCLYRFDIDSIIWTAIPLNHRYFETIINIYIKYLFDYPFLSTEDPFQNKSYFRHLSLSRTMFSFGELSEKKIVSRLNTVFYTLYQFNTQTKNKEPCTFNFQFNIETVRWISSLITGAATYTNNTITQKEVGGGLRMKYLQFKKEEFVWETYVDFYKDLFYYNELETRTPEDSKFLFHTHPRGAYNFFKTTIGYPSGTDYSSFLYNVVRYNTIFSAVISIEGIYIVSLRKEWCKINSDKNNDSYFNILANNINNYPKILEIIGNTYFIQKPSGIKVLVNDFLNIVNNISARTLDSTFPDIPMVVTSFKTWSQVENGDIFSIYYPTIYDCQCYPTEEILNRAKQLYKQFYINPYSNTQHAPNKNPFSI